MQRTYHAVVEFNDKVSIKKISVPDLGIHFSDQELFEYKIETIGPKTTEFIKQSITDRIKEILKANQIVPENKFDITQQKDNQLILEINVTVEKIKKGFFTRFLPGIGFALNIGTALSGVVINITQMELAMGNSTNKNSATALALIQAILSNSVGILFYVYLKSGQGLEKIGIKLDNYCSSKKLAFIENNKTIIPRSKCMSTCIMMMNLGLGSALVMLQLGNSTSLTGGLKALDEQRHLDSLISDEIFDIAKWTFILCGGAVGFIMAGMVFSRLSDDIQNWLFKREQRSINNESVQMDDLKEIVIDDVKNEIESSRKEIEAVSPR